MNPGSQTEGDPSTPLVSIIVPARNEEASLGACLQSLVQQPGVSYEIIVVDDHSTDRTREIAERFAASGARSAQARNQPIVNVIAANPLPAGWTGKCNAVWSGASIARGKWLLFTDADTHHSPDTLAHALREAEEHHADVLSYSPRQEVQNLDERMLMPVIFAELARAYQPHLVSDPESDVAAANGQYLLIRREAYDAIGGHAAVAREILEDVALAKLVKQAGYKLFFRHSTLVGTRMYRNFAQMWQGWTKNLALLFPNTRWLALKRVLEFWVIVLSLGGLLLAGWIHDKTGMALNGAIAAVFLIFFFRRIRRAHFDWGSNLLAILGLPLFSLLLLNSDISHKKGKVIWKGRSYGAARN